jgi:hypothetical protein
VLVDQRQAKLLHVDLATYGLHRRHRCLRFLFEGNLAGEAQCSRGKLRFLAGEACSDSEEGSYVAEREHQRVGVLMAALAAFALPGLLVARARPVAPVADEPVEPPTTTAPGTPAPTAPTGRPAGVPGERVAA